MPVPSPEGTRFVDVEDVRIRFSVTGSGRPLLLIMGIGASLDLWAPFEAALAGRGFSTIAYDAPGTGQSTRHRVPRRIPGMARNVVRLLDTLGYDRVDVLGVSFGGGVAQQLAHAAPHRVRRLVLAATMPGVGGVPGNPRALMAMATPRRYYDADYFRRVAPTIYGGAARRDPDATLHASAQRFTHAPTVGGYAGQLWAISGWSSLRWLHRLPQRTLVLAGDDDPIVPVVNARILARRIPRARLVVLPGAGHLFLLEQAAEAAGLVSDFLAEP